MLVRDEIDNALTLVVPTSATRDHSFDDLEKLMRTYGILEKAKEAFLNQEIIFEEYISLCEKAEVNIDSYLKTIEHNLIEMKLI